MKKYTGKFVFLLPLFSSLYFPNRFKEQGKNNVIKLEENVSFTEMMTIMEHDGILRKLG